MSFWQLLTSVNGEQIKQLAADHTGLALILCFASGILTSLTPCVYPMIPITINIFGRAAQQSPTNGKASYFNRGTFFLAVVYVSGMCATYSIMGVIAGLTGSLFGKWLQSSYLLGFLTLLFFSLALSQLGLFKMSLPLSLQTKLSQFGNAENKAGIFIMGLVSGLIVSPCVGPVIAGILAFVFDSSNALLGFAYFFSFSLGLGVLFLVIGGFSGIIGKLPRSGSWMTRINRVLACLMLFAAFYYGSVWTKQVGILKSANTSHLTWMTNEAEAYAASKALNRPIIVDFLADWCAACHEIDRDIFSNATVERELQKFVLLRLDVTQDNDQSTELLSKYAVLSLPAIVFVKPNGDIIEKPRVNGLVPVSQFMTTLNSVANLP